MPGYIPPGYIPPGYIPPGIHHLFFEKIDDESKVCGIILFFLDVDKNKISEVDFFLISLISMIILLKKTVSCKLLI